MGFFSKIFKGIKKVVKKIGSGIKKVAMKVGKFMDKIGIVGQIGLALILPGVGQMLGQWAGSMMAYSGFGSTVVNGLGTVLNAAVNIGTKIGNVFSTVTEGVTKVFGEVAAAGLDSLGLSNTTFGKYLAGKGFTGDISGAFTNLGSGVKASVGDLFSSSTLTATNKYAVQATTEALTTTVQEGLQSKIDASINTDITTGMPQPDVGVVGTEGWKAAPSYAYTHAEGMQLAGASLEDSFALGTPTIGESVVQASTATPSLLDRGITYATETGKAMISKAGEALTEVPGQFVKTYTGQLAAEAASGTAQQLGLVETPDYSSYYASVPTVDLSAAPISNDPYGSNLLPSVQTLQASPYGFGARVYSQGYNPNQYAALLAQVG